MNEPVLEHDWVTNHPLHSPVAQQFVVVDLSEGMGGNGINPSIPSGLDDFLHNFELFKGNTNGTQSFHFNPKEKVVGEEQKLELFLDGLNKVCCITFELHAKELGLEGIILSD